MLLTGKSLDSPEKGNVDKMSEKGRKVSEQKKCPEIVWRGCKHNFRTFFGQFLPVWSVLLFGDSVQCSPVAKLQCCFQGAHHRKPQELAGGFQGSRLKNASVLSQKSALQRGTSIPLSTLILKSTIASTLGRTFLAWSSLQIAALKKKL